MSTVIGSTPANKPTLEQAAFFHREKTAAELLLLLKDHLLRLRFRPKKELYLI